MCIFTFLPVGRLNIWRHGSVFKALLRKCTATAQVLGLSEWLMSTQNNCPFQQNFHYCFHIEVTVQAEI